MVITTTPLAAREPYKAVAVASFKMVIDSIRFGSISYNLETLTSKPSIIKVGRFGLSFKFDFDNASASNCLTPKPDSPRIYTSGKALGSDPQRLFSLIRKEGSNACNALITFVFETFNKSSFFTVTALPVKLELRIFI